MNGNPDQIIHFIQCKLIFNLFCISQILRISNYGTVSTGSSAFIIGGWIGKSSFPWRTSIIVQFQNNEWNKIGNLKEVKSNPSAILHNEEHLVIGGDPQKTDGRLVN